MTATAPGVHEIILRLALTCVAGTIIGINRDEHGRPAGLRTTLLVALAAAVSMLQASLLMDSRGKSSDSFVVLDLMRFPLGILSGMGFIGAAAVFKRGDLVLGVTTAATLWFVTVIGLCFGGGQLALGGAALVLCVAILWLLRLIEPRLERQHRATLRLTIAADSLSDDQLRQQLERAKLYISRWSIQYQHQPDRRTISCDVRWRAPRCDTRPPPLIAELARAPHVEALQWRV